MPIQVCMGATMMCSFGMAPSSLVVLPTNRVMTDEVPDANIMDHIPLVNIMPFGMCMSPANPTVAAATAAAMGVLTPMPCIPATVAPWVPGIETVMLGNMPTLDNASTLMCMWGGVITFVTPGEFTVMVSNEPGSASEAGGGAPAAAPVSKPPAASTAAPAKASAPKVNTGLGASVDNEIAKSPKFSQMIQDLQSKGYKFQFGPKGGGTKCNKNTKTIIVDENQKGKTGELLSSLAHEGGHASYKADPYVSHKGLTKQQYVDANVKGQLKDEGEATLTSVEIRNDLKKNGGPTIAVPGAQAAQYEKIAAKYPDPKDRDKAREEIGSVFADHEQPSGSAKGTTYKAYYSKPYSDYYDKLPANQQTPPTK